MTEKQKQEKFEKNLKWLNELMKEEELTKGNLELAKKNLADVEEDIENLPWLASAYNVDEKQMEDLKKEFEEEVRFQTFWLNVTQFQISCLKYLLGFPADA